MDRVIVVANMTVRRKDEPSFREFERIAARRLAAHGAQIERTVVSPHEEDPALFREIHVVRFPDTNALLSYRGDAQVIAAMPLRDRAVVRTEILAGEPGPDYHASSGSPREGTSPGRPSATEAPGEGSGRVDLLVPLGGPSAPDAPDRSVSARASAAVSEGMPETEVRPFRLADEEAVIDLWVRCELVRPWNDPRRDIRRKLEVQPHLFLVLLEDTRIVGTVMAGYEGHRGWINYLAVDPRCRRGGLGRRLVSEVEAALLGMGCPKVNLQMRKENTLASRFYEALGYREDQARSFGKRLIEDVPLRPPASPGQGGWTDPSSRVSGSRDEGSGDVVSGSDSPRRARNGGEVPAAVPAGATRTPDSDAVPLSPNSVVSLREIDAQNVRRVTRLAVADTQRRFVADNATSLAEALVCPHAWYRAIYADETPVGFCMVYEDRETPLYYLWRFMLDARYQRLGFGRQALEQVIERGRTLSWADEMLLSLVEGDGGPQPFYESLGFVSTGRYDDGELVLRRSLER